MADELRLKVSAAEYSQSLSVLDGKIAQLETLLIEYKQLELDADHVFGEGDSNLSQLKQNVEKNIKAVEGQREMLLKSRQELEKQNEQLGIQSNSIQQLLTQAGETAKTAFNTIKLVGDMVT